MSDPCSPDRGRLVARLALDRGAFRLRVELDLPASGVSAIFGPSGSGKTTCLRALAGLDRARGSVSVGGVVWQDDERGVWAATYRRGVGLVFQDAALFSHLSVKGNLDYAVRRRRPDARAPELAVLREALDLGALLDRSARTLSGGERQRVAIARALLAGPRLLLMDEPMAGLDAERKAEVFPYLERLRDDLAVPIVYVSHALDEVARLASRLVLLQEGRVIGSGPTAEVLAKLDWPLAVSDEASVIIDAVVAARDAVDEIARLDFDGGSLWVGSLGVVVGRRVRVRVLARDVSLSREAPGVSSILNVLVARVADLRDLGPDRVVVRLGLGSAGAPLLSRITRRSREALGIEAGVTVYAMVKSVALVA